MDVFNMSLLMVTDTTETIDIIRVTWIGHAPKKHFAHPRYGHVINTLLYKIAIIAPWQCLLVLLLRHLLM